MSVCISRHGEFGEHYLDDSYTCTLCRVLDEDALREELERLRGKAPEPGPELPWALRDDRGCTRLRVHVWPSLEAPRTGALTVADGWAEFTVEELEQGIAAMTEAAWRIRAHVVPSAVSATTQED